MEKFLKKSSSTDCIISAIFILFGIMLISRPDTIMSAVSILLGTICILIGILKGINYYSSGKDNNYLLAFAIILVILGIVVMFCGDIIFSLFRLIIAIWIIYSGLRDLYTVIVWKDYKSRLWLLTLILCIAMILGGIYILANSASMMQIIGGIIIAYIVFIKKLNN